MATASTLAVSTARCHLNGGPPDALVRGRAFAEAEDPSTRNEAQPVRPQHIPRQRDHPSAVVCSATARLLATCLPALLAAWVSLVLGLVAHTYLVAVVGQTIVGRV